MGKRRWNKWPERFGQEITRTSGVVGFVGVGLAAAGAVLSAPVVAVVGAITVAGAAVVSATRAIPPKLRSPNELLGKIIKINELDNIYPAVQKLGIIGASSAGKSTLLNRVRHEIPLAERTDELYAVIVALQATGGEYIALIDGAGQEYEQQFIVAENSDLLTIVLDHNESDSVVKANNERIKNQDEFIEQIIFSLKRKGVKKRIHMLLNKRDVWEKSANKENIEKWFLGKVDELAGNNITSQITHAYHSNFMADDVTKYINIIQQEVA